MTLSRIAVEGASQGGALTFATAALNNDRIAVCAPQVPFLSDFRDYFQVATWPGNEFIALVEHEKRLTWDQVYNTLSYFDIKNLAHLIRAPLIMGVGLMDEVCPPHINFAAYNLVDGREEIHCLSSGRPRTSGGFLQGKDGMDKNEAGIEITIILLL
ncbi:MAG: acetylxylan esterase [Marinilabiliales bacterium]|nr:acetylxylan esterase [Marinilabiliales bacterium]